MTVVLHWKLHLYSRLLLIACPSLRCGVISHKITVCWMHGTSKSILLSLNFVWNRADLYIQIVEPSLILDMLTLFFGSHRSKTSASDSYQLEHNAACHLWINEININSKFIYHIMSAGYTLIFLIHFILHFVLKTNTLELI